MALRLCDLSDEFAQTLDRLEPGSVSTYEASFQRMRLVGITAIDNTVVICRTDGEATLRFARLGKRTCERGYLQQLRAGSLGQECVNFTRSESTDGAEASAHAIIFRRDRFVVTLTIVGCTGTLGRAEAEELGEIVDQRIQQLELTGKRGRLP